MAETPFYIFEFLSRPYILLLLAFLLDLCIGDPLWLPHPVRTIGWLISRVEGYLRVLVKDRSGIAEKAAGISLVIIVVSLVYAMTYVIDSFSRSLHSPAITAVIMLFIMVFLTGTTLAAKELIDSARDIINALNKGDISNARIKLGKIVGRDTHSLDEKNILKATIESLAENASDGIIAPVFYFAVGGLPLAMTYKAINTMDSMLGYKNEKYMDFGWAAAKLDDIANFVPARITGLLIALTSSVVLRSLSTVHSSLKIMFRDGRNHPSPNSGVPEAAIAGALGVRLGGPSKYKGILVKKPYIGEETIGDYLTASERTSNIVKISSILGITIAVIALFVRASLC